MLVKDGVAEERHQSQCWFLHARTRDSEFMVMPCTASRPRRALLAPPCSRISSGALRSPGSPYRFEHSQTSYGENLALGHPSIEAAIDGW